MCLVAVVAGSLALLRIGLAMLPVVLAVLIPLIALSVLLQYVPGKRPSWRRGINAGRLGWLILGAGWLWARLIVSFFQKQEGLVDISNARRADFYEFWGLTVPSVATGVCLIVYVIILAVSCISRRRPTLLWLVGGYAVLLLISWFIVFVELVIEAFLD
jgi:hypothetical protein